MDFFHQLVEGHAVDDTGILIPVHLVAMYICHFLRSYAIQQLLEQFYLRFLEVYYILLNNI